MGNGKEVITVALQFDYESELDKLSNNLNKVLNKSGSEMTDKMRDGIKSLQSQIKELKTSVESLRNAPSGASEYGKVIEGLQTQFKQLSIQVISLEKQFRDMGSSVAQSSEVKEITNTIGALDEAVKKTTSSVQNMTNSVNKTDGSTLKSELKETKQAAEETAKALDELSNKTTVYKNQTNTTTQRKGKTIKTLGWTELTDFFQTVTKNAVIKNDGSLSITSEKVRTNYEALEKEITKIDSKIVQLQFDMGTQGEAARASTQRQLVMLREYLDLLEKTRNKQIGSPAYLPDSGNSQVIDTVRSQTLISKYNEQITKVSNSVDKLLNKVHELQKTPGISSDYADDLNKADGILKNLSTDLESLFNKIKAENGSISDQDILQFFDSYSKGTIFVENILGFDKLSKKLDTTYQKIAKLRIELNTADPTSRSFIQQQISELEDFAQQIKQTQAALSTIAGANSSEMTSKAALTQYSQSLKKVQDNLVRLLDKVHELQETPSISSDYSNDLDDADKKVQKLQTSILNLWASIQRGQADENSIKAFFDTYGDESERIQKTIDFSKTDKQLADLKNELIEINSELVKTTKFEDNNALRKKKEAIEEVINALTNERNLELGLSGTAAKTYNNSKASISQYNEEVIKTNDSLNKMREKIASLISDSSRSTSFKNELGLLDAEIFSFQSDLVKAFNVLESDPFNTTSINTFYDQLRKVVVILEKYNSTISNSTSSTAYSATREEVQKLDNRISAFLDQNSAAANRFKQQLLGIQSVLRDTLSNNGELTKLDLSSYSEQANKIESEIKSLHQTGNSFFTSLRKQLQSANAQFIGTYFSIQDFIRYAKEIFDAVTEIDSALTELRKVSDATSARLVESFETSAEAARDLGASVKDVINETADWSRLGYSVDEAEELAKVTTLFKNVGDNMSAETASEYMISALQGFQMAAADAEHIVDAYNEVANNFAIDTAGIGEALERSASSFTAANTSMEKAIALVTATNEVIQNPESVGTLWKTMSARLRGAATELAELGEEEDEFTKTTSKLRDLVMGLTGFDIMIDEDNFKDIYDIILGIGEKWDELTDIEQASLGEALAGKRNANAFYAVIGNLDTLKGAYEAASESAGSAAKEQENFEKSIQYSLNRLSATFEVLATDFLSSDFAKGAVDFLTGIVELLDSIVNHIGVLIPLLSTFGGLAIIKNINNIKGLSDLGKSLALMSEAGKTIDTLKTAGASADAFAQGLKALTFEQTAAALAEKQINAALIEEILKRQGVEAQLAKETATRATLTAAQSAQVKSTFSLSAAYKGLAASVGLSAGAFTALLGVGALLGGLAYSIYEVLQESEKLAESARDLGQEFSKTKSEIDDYKIRVEELNEIINNSENLEEVREAREQLLSIQKEMIDKYGDEAEKVIDLTNTLKDQTSAWNELSKAQWQQTKNAFNANKKWNPFDDWNRSLYDAESNLDLMLQKMENTSYTLEFEYDDIELAEKIQELYGLERGLSTPGTYGLAVTGNLNEVRQTFLEIQSLLETSDDVSDETLKNITESAQAIEDTFDSYSDIYNQYVYFERILDQNKPEYEDYYNAVKQAYSDFEKAYTEGDTLAQQNALKQIAERKNAIIDAMKETDGVIDAEEKSILVFVDSLMPLISDQLSSKQLELDIAVNADNIKESLEKAVETFDSVENIPDKLNILTGQELTEEQKAAWETLNESATEYGLTIQELIDLLAKLGVIEVDYNPDIPKELRDQVEAVNNRLDGNYLPAYQQYYKEANESLISSEDVHNANEYAKSLDSIYQKYNGIDNMNRDFIYWDDETLKKNEQFITEMFGSYEEGVEWLKDTWSTVLGGTAQEGEIQIAYTQLLQTPDGLLPLTEDVVWDYIDSIYSKAFDENGEFDVEKFIRLDSEGADVLINGQMQHVANLIAAAEGQYLNGIKLTADDVIAIGNPGYDENGNDLLPDIESIFKGYSMHEVQEKTLLGRFNEFLKSLIPEFKPETLDEFFEEMQIDTEEEYQLWLDVASGCTSATEAMQKYRDAVAEVSNVDPFNYNSLSDAVSDIDKKLVPQFKELGELYDEIFNGDNGFELSGIDTSDLKGVIDAFNDLDAALEIDPPTEAIDEFLYVIGNPSSTSDQVQKSFDAIATAYFNAAVEAGNFSEENAVVLEQMLTEMGIVNASDVVAHYEALAAAKKLAADNGKNLAEMTALQIEEFAAEVGASDATADALYLLALKQIFLNENWINESDSIQQVLELAKAAGITADALDKLAQIQALQGAIDAEIATGNPTTSNLLDYNTRLEQLQANASEYADAVEQAIQEKLSVDIEFSVPKTGGSGGSSASDAGKDAADEYVKAFEEELKDLERLRDAGVISEKEFLERYKDLIEKYFKDVDGYADEYADRMKDYFDRLTTYYENIFSAISTVLSHRINALQDAKSAAVDAINAEKDAAAESYQTQIDYLDELIDAKEAEIDAIDDEIEKYEDQISAIDKQIEALEDANEHRQKALDLQKAQMALEQAQNQRTKMIYKGGQLVKIANFKRHYIGQRVMGH